MTQDESNRALTAVLGQIPAQFTPSRSAMEKLSREDGSLSYVCMRTLAGAHWKEVGEAVCEDDFRATPEEALALHLTALKAEIEEFIKGMETPLVFLRLGAALQELPEGYLFASRFGAYDLQGDPFIPTVEN